MSSLTTRWRKAAAETSTKKGARAASRQLSVDALEDRIAPAVSLVADINLGSQSAISIVSDFVVVGNSIFFAASDRVHGSELWKTDSRTGDTVLLKDISPGSNSSKPSSLTDVNGELFFQAD